MDASRFDRLVTSFVRPGTRRGLLRLLAAVPVVSLPLAAPSLPAPLAGLVAAERAAKGKRQGHGGDHRQADARKPVDAAKKKKKKCARAGQTTSKKRKKCCAGLSKNASGVCTQPSPPPSSCNCSATQLCVNGVCQDCTVTCTRSPAVCGTALQTAFDGSASTIYVCPGRYQPPTADGFEITSSKTVIGAGQGAGSASNTILDANNQGSVLSIYANGLVTLEQLRIIDGTTIANRAGGVNAMATNGTLRMIDCTVNGNSSSGALASGGGGIFVFAGTTLEMTRSTVSGNSASGPNSGGGGIWANGNVTLIDSLIQDNLVTGPNGATGGGIFCNVSGANIVLTGTTQVTENTSGQGGGIWVGGGSVLTIAETCRVTNNTAPSPQGGGIFNDPTTPATVTLQGATPSPIVVNNCHENCVGTVAKCAATPISCPA